jgi:hypothetical protein
LTHQTTAYAIVITLPRCATPHLHVIKLRGRHQEYWTARPRMAGRADDDQGEGCQRKDRLVPACGDRPRWPQSPDDARAATAPAHWYHYGYDHSYQADFRTIIVRAVFHRRLPLGLGLAWRVGWHHGWHRRQPPLRLQQQSATYFRAAGVRAQSLSCPLLSRRASAQ